MGRETGVGGPGGVAFLAMSARLRSPWSLALRLRRATAVLAGVLQLLLTLAPLLEVGKFDSSAANPGGVVEARLHTQGVAHNELTCPACIARSLHSSPELRQPRLIFTAEQYVRPRLATAVISAGPPAALHFSRAPPFAG